MCECVWACVCVCVCVWACVCVCVCVFVCVGVFGSRSSKSRVSFLAVWHISLFYGVLAYWYVMLVRWCVGAAARGSQPQSLCCSLLVVCFLTGELCITACN